ncbi:MAG TPA: hypothetical protein VMT10_11100 [Solirubrobacteraceae bacterium]|nr:hypothetical protein [Solirubrobacteraceae bacterium]
MNAQPEPAPAGDERRYLDRSRLARPELIGMVSGLVLIVSLWLPWFSTSSNPNSQIYSAHIGPNQTASAWDTFPTLRWLLLALGLAPFILAWIVARGHKLTWRPGEVTMIVGMAGVVLVLGNGIIFGRPAPHVGISLDWGYWLGLLACVGIVVAGYQRQATFGSGPKRPPGSV